MLNKSNAFLHKHFLQIHNYPNLILDNYGTNKTFPPHTRMVLKVLSVPPLCKISKVCIVRYLVFASLISPVNTYEIYIKPTCQLHHNIQLIQCQASTRTRFIRHVSTIAKPHLSLCLNFQFNSQHFCQGHVFIISPIMIPKHQIITDIGK